MTAAPRIASQGLVYVFGEPMIELSSIAGNTACLGVGGDTFNTSVYLSRAGIDVQYVTAIGDDPMSERVLHALKEEGIGTDHVSVIPGKPVGLYAISLDEHGERDFTYWRQNSAFRSWFTTRDRDETIAAMAQAGMLYLSGITLSVFSEDERTQINALIRKVRDNGGRVAFDTNYRPTGWAGRNVARDAIGQVMPHISIALPTFEDDASLFGTATPEECIDSWLAAGAREVCVKSGDRGALLSGNGWVEPETPLKPKDTTGAGDSFNGAYLAARLQGEAPATAASHANTLAGRVIMTSGAILPKETQI
ncbi:MAG: sugar kinase [Pseudomonadota bacterium]